MTLHAWQQWPAAHQAYQRAIALAPDAWQWRYLDGLVLEQLGRPRDAAARFAEALEIEPAHLPSRVERARALLDAGDHDTARELYSELLKEAAAEPLAAYGLGRLAALAGRHDEAAAMFERAIRLFPEFGAAYYGLALAERARGRKAEAAAALEKHREYGNRWPAVDDPLEAAVAARKKGASEELKRGIALALKGDVEGAIAAHEAALAAEPDLPQARVNLISLYGRLKRWDEAEKHYEAAVESGKNLAEAHYNYGVMLGLQERWDEAAEAYRQAVAVNPSYAQAYNNLGQILERQHRLPEAAQAYEKAVESQPALRLARFNLGRMLIAANRAAEAVDVLEPLRQPRDAETARYLFALSVALVRAGKTTEGIAVARDAHKLAVEHQQAELAAAIERNLKQIQ